MISVVMSVYNGQKYLNSTIESVLGQSYNNFEFIIIDDGSTDRTKIILDHYSEKDLRIKVFNQANGG